MSRHDSPLETPHNLVQMYRRLPPSAAEAVSKFKVKGHVAGITAGAEDVKYQAKYKELKKKVKEIESDNDRLYLKLLLAKKNIRRMNLERAILYERLAQVPPTPGRNPQELPPENEQIIAQQQHPGPVEPVRTIDADQRSIEEYQRNHPNARLMYGPDGRVVAIEDPAAHPRDALGLSGPPPPQGIPIVGGTEPVQAYEAGRQHPQPVPFIREPQPPAQEPSHAAHDRSPVYHAAEPPAPRQSLPSSQYHGHSHSHSPHRSRASFSRHDHDVSPPEHGRLDTLPPTHVHGHSRSSSLSGEGQAEQRSRRHDIHELAGQHGHIPHPRVEVPTANLPPSPTAPHSPTHGRIHNHQRIGPGMHLHRQQERDPEVTRQLLLEREREKEREREREIEYHERRAREEEELRQLMPLPSWREEQPSLSGPGVSRDRSRSDTPASGGAASGGGGSSRPDSSQSHERERRSYAAPRVANLLSDPRESYYDSRDERVGHAVSHSRSYPPEYGPESSRKRSRHDMEIDDDHRGGEIRSPLEAAGGSRSGGPTESYPVSHELRGPKRIHPDEEDDVKTRGYVSSVRDEKPMEQDD